MTILFNKVDIEDLKHQRQLLQEHLEYPFQFHLPQWENRFPLLNILKNGQYKILRLGMPTLNSFDNLAPRCGLV